MSPRDYLLEELPTIPVDEVVKWEEVQKTVAVLNRDDASGPAYDLCRQAEYTDQRTGFLHQRCGGGSRVFRKR